MNQKRRKFWQELVESLTPEEVEKALASINPVSAQVLKWHYYDCNKLSEIVTLLNKSISIVRNHHNRGIFELRQYTSQRKCSAKNPRS
ncbi:hypothetical protein CAP36_12370 [Chitinophagaceae bacterium IBVUCB2]|nr:hypothetical protein CAP36_12370 [Chitinophagaceae bacterium IBVUCB2]